MTLMSANPENADISLAVCRQGRHDEEARMQNLFGEEVAIERPRKTPKPKGHAAPPGSGPAGETCRTCEHYTRRHFHDYVHRKCGLMKARWTKGPGSDIRAKDPACRLWVKASEEAR
jgi:hypothetical protein